jgi:hypothetical protein
MEIPDRLSGGMLRKARRDAPGTHHRVIGRGTEGDP